MGLSQWLKILPLVDKRMRLTEVVRSSHIGSFLETTIDSGREAILASHSGVGWEPLRRGPWVSPDESNQGQSQVLPRLSQ